MAVVKSRLLITTAAAGTLSRLVVPQLSALLAQGWDVHLAAGPDRGGDLVGVEVPFHPIKSLMRLPSPRQDAKALWEMRQLIHRLQPEVVMGGTPKGALVTMLASRFERTPVRVYHVRGARWEGATGKMQRALIAAEKVTVRCATDVLSVSKSVSNLMVADGICRTPPLVLGAGGSKGVDLARFYPREVYPQTVTAPVIGFVGRLATYKGLDISLDVFDAVVQQYPTATMKVVGGEDPSYPMPDEVRRRLEAPNIDVLGRIDPAAVGPEMRKFDLLVFPSQREGLPNVVIEAAASGVPTVGWDTTGVRDAISDGISGAVLAEGDVEGLTSSALSILASDRVLNAQGARTWAENFDSVRLAEMLGDYLRSRIDVKANRKT